MSVAVNGPQEVLDNNNIATNHNKYNSSVPGRKKSDENSLNGTEKKSYEELLKKIELDDQLREKKLDYPFLMKFLLCHQFDVDATLAHIKGYFSVRKSFPGLYLKPSETRDVYQKKIMFKPNVRGANGEGIMIIRVINWCPKEMTAEHAMAGGIAYSELVEVDDSRRRAGIWEIIDAKGLCWSQIWSLKLSDYKLLAEGTELGQSFNFNGIVCINASSLVDFVYNKFLKWFFTKDFRDKIRIYSGDWSEIFEFIPRNAVPVDMKGTLEGSDCNDWTSEELQEQDKAAEEYWEKYK